MSHAYSKKIAVIIPALNPDSHIIKLVDELKKVAGFQKIIVVNDGSQTSYNNYFATLNETYSCIVLHHIVNQGKGRALKTAFNYLLENERGLVGAVTVDADGQHSVEDIINVAQALIINPDQLILGCRRFTAQGIPLRSKAGNIITSKLLKILCGVNISDTQTGLRGIPAMLIPQLLSTEGERFDYETNMILNFLNGVGIMEVPIKAIYIEQNSSSHFNPLFDSLQIYKIIMKYTIASFLSVIVDFAIFTMIVKASQSILAGTFLGRLASGIFNFTLNKNLVFRDQGNGIVQIIGYGALLFISGMCSAALVSVISRYIFRDHLLIIKAVVDSFLFFVNFYLQNHIIFKKVRGVK